MAHSISLAALEDDHSDPYADGYDMAIEQCLEVIRRWHYSGDPIGVLLNQIDELAQE